MKEFGVYVVKNAYLNDFLAVENQLAGLKIPTRPFVCIKISNKNWMIPLSSINPNSTTYSYQNRLKKQRHYNFVDTQNPPKAMDIFDDLLHTGTRGYKSVALYYNAIPVKHSYCKKYFDASGAHASIDSNIGKQMQGRLLNYLAAIKQGKNAGFIDEFVKQGKTNYESYPFKAFDLQKALYRKELQLRAVRRKKNQENAQLEQERQRRRELKQQYKNGTADLVAAALDHGDEKYNKERTQNKSKKENA